MVTRIYLSAIGLLYLGLAVWCTVAPADTSDRVGFELKGGSGQSEFMTVYGGLEFGMALLFLAPIVSAGLARPALLACLTIHGSLVAFRTASLMMFSGIQPMTWKLAAGEWVILLTTLSVFWFLAPETKA